MAWIQIRLNSTNEKAEKISDFLEEIGSVSVTFMDSPVSYTHLTLPTNREV